MKTEEAYLYFLGALKTEEEGVFWSRVTEGDSQWTFGAGQAQKKDFDDACFPLFAASDFLGNHNLVWYFDRWYSSVLKGGGVLEQEKELSPVFYPSLKSSLGSCVQEKAFDFCEKIKHIQTLQKNGDMWVLNLSHKLEGAIEDHQRILKNFYHFLKSGRTHVGGVIWTKELKCISFSPETFLIEDRGCIITFPIKGTGERNELKHSHKEQSELAMVTDLMRNDLSQIAKNVRVNKERSFTDQIDFYHSHAEIAGDLIHKYLRKEDFLKLLPAGSISGSPKIRVIEEILKQESYTRDFYTGTFGVRFSKGYSIFNILIRTLFFSQDLNTWSYPVGAGITLDSVAEKEWEETLRKAEILKYFF